MYIAICQEHKTVSNEYCIIASSYLRPNKSDGNKIRYHFDNVSIQNA